MKIELDIFEATKKIVENPSNYAEASRARADRISTPGRKHQAVIAAGRNALAQALFEIHPELGGSFQKLTKAIRAQCGENFNFEELNKTGARALGFDI